MRKQKYSPNFDRDYDFYFTNIGKFDFIGSDISNMRPEEGTNTLKKVFHVFDSQGKTLPCEDPDMFLELIKFKKGLNFWIKYWAEGFSDILEPIEDYLSILDGDVPEWVETSFINQIKKMHGDTPGNTIINAKKEMGVFERYLSRL